MRPFTTTLEEFENYSEEQNAIHQEAWFERFIAFTFDCIHRRGLQG